MDLNEVKLIGRIGKEPEFSETNDGKVIAKLSIATSKKWVDKVTSEKKEKTQWHKVVVYNQKIATMIDKHKDTLKGTTVYVSGELTYKTWVDQSGKNQRSTSIEIDMINGRLIFISKLNTQSSDENKKNFESSSKDSESFAEDNYNDDESDNIPF